MNIMKHLDKRAVRLFFALIAFIVGVSLFSADAFAQAGFEKAPPPVLDAISHGNHQDIIVLFDDAFVQDRAFSVMAQMGLAQDAPKIIALKAEMFGAIKQDAISLLPAGEFDILKDYTHLPMMFVRIKSIYALERLLEQGRVLLVYEDARFRHFLSQSLALINQPQVASLGKIGTGTTVAVLDTGVDYTRSAFGACTSPAPGFCSDTNPPAAPLGCKVVCARDFTPVNDNSLDNNEHGTNVAGIVLGVAPDTRIAALDVFRPDGLAYSSDILSAINWSIANKTAYNIVAINMSLGGGGSTTLCSGSVFSAPISSAKSAGIISAVASGNNGFTNMISEPACAPSAVSVGAVYDSNVGPRSWSGCTDSTTSADRVICFSNSASFLTVLAPGSVITAADISMSGTSQAAPHIAGSIAVLKGSGAFPSDTPDQTITRMTSTGVSVIDPKNDITKPRIDLLAATGGGGGGTFSISGTVMTSGGVGPGGSSPLSGVTITLSGAASRTATTNSVGSYTFTGLANGTYTATPSRTGYIFTPASRTAAVSGANITNQNFTGTLSSATYSISGTVTEGSSPLSGVTITLSGAASRTATTDASGNYTFTGLANGTYTITPSRTGYTFTPISMSVTISGANLTGRNFTGTSSGGTYSISGTVMTSGGVGPGGSSPLSGVTMTLSGDTSGTAITNSTGSYTFTGLANGSYTITPSRTGYTFTPTSMSVTVSGANLTGKNFTGVFTGVTTYSVSGTVMEGGSPLSGVTMTLSGDTSGTAITNSTGSYTFTGLANGSYTITPSRTGYTFTPISMSVTVSGANLTGRNFTGTSSGGTYSISGTVMTSGGVGPGGSSPLSGVTMTLSGAASGTATTNSTGSYTFTGLANGSYTITPSRTGYTFTPASRTANVSGSNITGQNFTATASP